jgi:hypothetical protein
VAHARGRLGGRPSALAAVKALLGDPAITVEQVAKRRGSRLPLGGKKTPDPGLWRHGRALGGEGNLYIGRQR